MGNRYTYTDEFKAEAVAYARSSDKQRYRIAESLGVSDGALAMWIKDAERAQQPGALSVDERAELNPILSDRPSALAESRSANRPYITQLGKGPHGACNRSPGS